MGNSGLESGLSSHSQKSLFMSYSWIIWKGCRAQKTSRGLENQFYFPTFAKKPKKPAFA